jgi:hypothetical protein
MNVSQFWGETALLAQGPLPGCVSVRQTRVVQREWDADGCKTRGAPELKRTLPP